MRQFLLNLQPANRNPEQSRYSGFTVLKLMRRCRTGHNSRRFEVKPASDETSRGFIEIEHATGRDKIDDFSFRSDANKWIRG